MKSSGGANVLLLGVAVATVGLGAASVAAPKGKPERVSFSRDVLPILSDKCFPCHGPDASSRQADMRLDSREGATSDRGGRWPIVPRNPSASLVYQRISSKESPMPPPTSGKALSSAEIELLRRWIAEGADYTKVWSFEPLPASVSVPEVPGDWPRDDLDKFVYDRLRKEGVVPSPPASKERWLRRVTLDLTGLPPVPRDIEAFLADRAEGSYERVVNRLLASPQFGERMAVDWLDAARYSDSYGYQSDLLSPTWPYRDWVVNAFNRNLRYDRFLTEQLAGDLLPDPTTDQRLATAFNRLHRQSNEGGSIALEFKTAYAVDRVDTFGTAVLGLTVGCARCHDHKFDPVTQREYYQLFAYFNSIDEYGLLLSTEIVPTPSLLLPSQDQSARLGAAKRDATVARQAMSAAKSSSGPRFAAWLATRPSAPQMPGVRARISLDTAADGKYADLTGSTVSGASLGTVLPVPGKEGQGVQLDGDNGIAVKGLPVKERYEPFTWSFWVKDPRTNSGPIVLLHRTGGTDVGFCGFDLLLEDGRLTARVMRHWPGNAVAVRTKQRIPQGRWANLAWTWDGSSRAEGLGLYVDGNRVATEVLNDRLWKSINAYGDLGPSGGDWSFGQRFRDSGFKGGQLDELVFADRELSPLEIRQLADGCSLTEALAHPAEHRAELKEYFLSALDPILWEARSKFRKSQEAFVAIEEPIVEVSVMEEAAREVPAYLLARGQYDAPRTEATRVVRGVPQALPALPKSRRNDRLTLARWTTDRKNPLTARVAVNRFWQMLFGTGLVETSENFGVQGSRPSYPELLDFLAVRFMATGWDVKAFFRSVVLSSTYRQDSARRPGLEADPANRLLARGPSGRLTAEMARDTVLLAAGLLNDRIGGPPVNPYQPAGIWRENNVMSPEFVQSKGSDLYRRSLYSTWKRTTPVPNMMLFDANSREACTVRRPSTNTPLQALVLLNDVQFVEAARALAALVLATPGTDADRLGTAFYRLASRKPSPSESAVLAHALTEQRGIYAADREAAVRLVTVGDSKPPGNLDPVELAAMSVAVQIIVNSDAVMWKR